MLYRFNNLTGRLVSSGLKRVGLKPSGEGAQIIYDSSIKFSKVPDQELKQNRVGSGGMVYGEVPAFFRELQIKFQEDNGVPVHLKGGPMDVALYYTTLVLCAIGVIECFRFYYVMSFPQPPPSADDDSDESGC